MDAGFGRVEKDNRDLRGEMNRRFDAVDRRLDSLYRAMLLFSGGVTVSLVGLIGSVLLTQM
jgi:hypothetical protein